tara:strand:- start:3748 stop:3867 length:120 start_codon:yes stop_codon:yes gene_type:complete
MEPIVTRNLKVLFGETRDEVQKPAELGILNRSPFTSVNK